MKWTENAAKMDREIFRVEEGKDCRSSDRFEIATVGNVGMNNREGENDRFRGKKCNELSDWPLDFAWMLLTSELFPMIQCTLTVA